MDDYRRTHIRGSSHSEHSAEAREANTQFNDAKRKLQNFFLANNYHVVFTGGTTDSSNSMASRFPFNEGDLLLLTEMEHHSQMLTHRKLAGKCGTDVMYVPICLPDGRLDIDHMKRIVSQRRRGNILLNLVHVSNVTGVINPVKEIRDILGDRGCIYLDMAQSAGHLPINLDDLDVDFAGLSSHKMYGPMGIGVLFVRKGSERYISDSINGGGTVRLVSKRSDVAADYPARLEPGTPDIEGAIELGYTADYLRGIGMKTIQSHDEELGGYLLEELQKIRDVTIYGPKEMRDRTAVITFNVGSYPLLRKNYDQVATELDRCGISVRDGCFCAHPYISKLLGLPKLAQDARVALMKLGVSDDTLKLPGAVRASLAFYNTLEDAYRLVTVVRDIAQE